MGKIKEELVTFGKAELTASCASVIDFGLAFFLSDIVGIYYGLANALGVISGGSASGVRLYDIGCFLPGKFYFTGSCGDSSSRSDSRIFLPFCGLFKNRDITV